MKQRDFTYLAWGSFAFAILLPFIAWLEARSWRLDTLNLYAVFPLLGIWAWTIMWTHFLCGAFRVKNPSLQKPKYYDKITSYGVLAALLLHPMLLAIRQNQLGFGTPPNSFIEYAGEPLRVAIFLGTASLIIFLSFEFFDRMQKNAWVRRNWPWITISQLLAMLMIFIHALRLGQHLQTGWFMAVWLLMGIAMLPCAYIILRNDFQAISHTKDDA